MKKILFIAGTRPEAIKLAPLYLEMKRRPAAFKPVWCNTGQHKDLLEDGLGPFGIIPEIQLDAMRPGEGLSALAGALFSSLGAVLKKEWPNMTLVQGDTLSAFAGGWSSFLERIPVIHLEAGLRTGDLDHPFPEEANRRALSVISAVHFAPTDTARDNLINEGANPAQVLVTGNTAIDALYQVRNQSAQNPGEKRIILVTGHRRENFGLGLQGLCDALVELAMQFPDIDIIYTVHPNPAVRDVVESLLRGKANIHLVPPMPYGKFVQAMRDCYFIISDSGGVQEEAPALGKPVLVTRKTTERPEALAAGATLLVGTDPEVIVAEAARLLKDKDHYQRMATAGCPYGDGQASVRICNWLEDLEII